MKYPLPMRIIHWTMSIIILCLLAVGIYMAGLPSDAPHRYDWFFWHKSFGIVILGLIFVRMFVRYKSQLPPPAPGLTRWEHRAALLSHKTLYMLMLFIPICGYIMSTTYVGSKGVSFFGLFMIPGIFPQNDEVSGIFKYLHFAFAYTLIAVLTIHVSAVIKHRFYDKKDVLKRML